MSFYEGLTSLGLINEKHTTVVFDFGYAYTKLGFAGETSPRAIVKSEVRCRRKGCVVPVFEFETEEELIQQLVDFIHSLYFKKLLANSKDRRVVIVESILGSSILKNAFATVFFKYYEVLSVLFVPSHLVSLMTLAINTGLVLDIGYSEASIIPIYEGVPILNAWQSVPLASKAIQKSLSELLFERGWFINEKGKEETLSNVYKELPEHVLEDIKVRSCLVSTVHRSEQLRANKQDRAVEPPSPPPALRYPLMGSGVLVVPGTVREMAAEVLFEMDGDNVSLASILLDCITKCPIDTRKALASNVVLSGGTAQMRGLKGRLLAEVRRLAARAPFCLRSNVTTFSLHDAPTTDDCVPWLGGSIMGCTEAALVRSLSKEAYLETSCLVPDWSNLSVNTKDDDDDDDGDGDGGRLLAARMLG